MEADRSLRYSKEPSTGSVLRQSHVAPYPTFKKRILISLNHFSPLYSKPSLFLRIPRHKTGMNFCFFPNSCPLLPPYYEPRLISPEDRRLYSSILSSFNRHILVASILLVLIILYSTTSVTTLVLCPFFNVIHNIQQKIRATCYIEITCYTIFVKLQIEWLVDSEILPFTQDTMTVE